MANSFTYKNILLAVGDMVTIAYKLKEDNKERIQNFDGIIIKIRGENENKMFTVRKTSKAGIGVEKILPVNSPYIADIKLNKKSTYRKAKAYFIRNLSSEKLRDKLYK